MRRVAYLCLLAIGAVVLITEIVLFAHGEAPLIAYLAVLIPAAAAAAPLAFVVVRLRDGQDKLALAVALSYPLAVLAALLLGAIRMWNGTTEDQMDLFARVVFFFADPVWAVFVVGFLPLLVRLGIVALRAIRTGSEGVPGVPLLAGATLVLLAGYQVVWRPLTETPRLQPTGLWHFNVRYLVDGGHEPGQGPMQGDLAFERMTDLYHCVIRYDEPNGFARFPTELAQVTAIDPRRFDMHGFCSRLLEEFATRAGPYRVMYEAGPPGPSGFPTSFHLTLLETDRGRFGLGTERWDGDESGVVRVAHLDWRGREIPEKSGLRFVEGLGHLLFLERFIAKPFDGDSTRRLPRRLVVGLEPDTAAGELGVGTEFEPCRAFPDSAAGESNEMSCIYDDHRRFIYRPIVDTLGVVTSYALTALAPWRSEHAPKWFSYYRSYHRDSTGAFHGAGLWRTAMALDPIVPDEELAGGGKWLESVWRLKQDDWRYGRR